MSREELLHRVRTALGCSPRKAVPDPPAVRIRIPRQSLEARVSGFTERLEALAGKVLRVATARDAGEAVHELIEDRGALASPAEYLGECGILQLPGVHWQATDSQEWRRLCATAEVGVTGADYALADTGSLVMLSTPSEARMVSLLPPAHIAVLSCERILSGLDELFAILPDPAAITSSMVLITGPSRTADIEQTLVRGVHGPGRLTVVLVG
jgi:L-lactate dehydrogenase complex protein LldG